MRVSFGTIFIQHPDESLEPKQRIRGGGVTMGPGVRFTKAVSVGGIDFTQFFGRDFEVQQDNDVLVITGIY